MENSFKLMEDPYVCMNCKEISELDKFEETECDGDVWGTCPKCKKHSMIVEWYDDSKEEESLITKEK